MPFREKTAWISVLSLLGIYGLYFRSVTHAGATPAGTHFGGLLVTVIAVVVVQVALIVAVAVMSPKDAKAPRDERDKAIELKATRIAYSGLATGVVLACFFAGFDPPILFGANALLFILVTAEILRSASLIVLYRRGA